MKDYRPALDQEMGLMHVLHNNLTSPEEFTARLERAWPKLQEQKHRWSLQRIMEVCSNAKTRR